MARYIDADALKTDILKKYKQNWEVPCSYEDRIIQRVVTDLRVLIEQNTPADVVPKSEVEKLEKEVERLTAILHSYALQYGTVADKQKVIDRAKAEVAREIFEEIDKAHEDCIVILGDMGYLQPYKFEQKIAELKKKYTEDKG